MCGIVTVFGSDMTFQHGEVMKDLLILDQLRGMHSTGVVRIDSTGKPTIKKEAVNGAAFVSNAANKTFVQGLAGARGIIGHNRYATCGAHTAVNAHPFQHDNITMVHNGTLQDRAGLATDEEHPSFVVDSDQVAFTLSQRTTAETVRQLDGAFVLAWHDKNDNSFNFVRNDERPFFLAKVTGQDVYIGASEEWMIMVACSRRKTPVVCDPVVELPVGVHVKYVLGTGPFTTKTTKPVLKPVELMPADEKYYGNWGNYNSSYKNSSKKYNSYQPPVKRDKIHGVTTTTARSGGIKDELSKLGLSIGQEVSVYLTYFLPYTMRDTSKDTYVCGKGYGSFDNVTGPNIACIVHAINEEEFVAGEYKAIVSSICHRIEDYNGKVIPNNVVLNRLELTKSWEDDKDKLVEDPDDIDLSTGDEPCATDAYVYGPDRVLITEKAFDDLAKYGCGICTCDITVNDDEDVSWRGDSPICHTCTEHGKVAESGEKALQDAKSALDAAKGALEASKKMSHPEDNIYNLNKKTKTLRLH